MCTAVLNVSSLSLAPVGVAAAVSCCRAPLASCVSCSRLPVRCLLPACPPSVDRISAARFVVHPIFPWTQHKRGFKTAISSGKNKQAEAISSLVEDTFLQSIADSFEIKRDDDGTSLGKYKPPPEGTPVSGVLGVIFKKYGLDGILLKDDSIRLTDSDRLFAGHTYTFRPSTNVPPPGENLRENQAKRLKHADTREVDVGEGLWPGEVSSPGVVPNPVPGAENLERGPHPATELFHRICDAVGKTLEPSSAFADPKTYVKLPFPSVAGTRTPLRFLCDSGNYWNYMGRKKYREVRNAILSVQARSEKRIIQPDEDLRPLWEASLWGNMGSGKSYILAAVVCELLYSFHKLSRVKVGAGELQRQRVIYLPDCSYLVSDDASRLSYFKAAFLLGYADDERVLEWLDGVKAEKALIDFVREEKARGVFLFIIVDQENALDLNGPNLSSKQHAHEAITSLAYHGGILKGASANNENAQRWVRKRNTRKVFLYGGLDEEEYGEWKKHLRTRTGKMECGSIEKDQEAKLVLPALLQLSTEDEERMMYDTGCLPLFLECWSKITSPEMAWREFFAMPEISSASDQLRQQMDEQLKESNANCELFTDMYRDFLTGSYVYQGPKDYDSRYLYRSTDAGTLYFGKFVCGVVKRIIAQHLQKLKRKVFLQPEWKQAIKREVKKVHPNAVMLGFMVEQMVVAKAWEEGMKLSSNETAKLDNVVYFETGLECDLKLQEGWTIYIPSAYNYARVDAVVRGWFPKLGCLSVAAVQMTMGNLQAHSSSENRFWHPSCCDVWFQNIASEKVKKYFIWYIQKSEFARSKKMVHSEEEVEVEVEKDLRNEKLIVRGHTRTFHEIEKLVDLE